MNRNAILIAASAFCSLTACKPDHGDEVRSSGTNAAKIDQETYNRIAECGGGISSVSGAKIEARIAQDLRSGSLSGEVKQEIKGLITNDPNILPGDRTHIYDSYLGCLKDIRTGS
ncbi:hypothetical protein [Stakelama marina]|uniref:Lipoprotein n=1 Tax=Stakelama marina TaxID=2826939 RepID=A0A8T4IG36_9SPHN|nr:hypothetical protein [Stakelama marina]MBR0552035.1 hypothetical protein [Stakelama marina]